MFSAAKLSTSTWIRLAFINLFVVSLLGVLMRYKIAFSLPWLDQKHLQHAHSHFAFGGWVSMFLMAAMVDVLGKAISVRRMQAYHAVLIIQLVSAAGMLVGFSWQGYGWFSVLWSTISLINGFIFCVLYFADARKFLHPRTRKWFNAALLFHVLSAIGTIALVYMMVAHRIPQKAYLASVYWYLHFQYNGWFFFAAIGLLNYQLAKAGLRYAVPSGVFALFFLACIPAYGLSILWLQLHWLVYLTIVVAAACQLLAFGLLASHILWRAKKIIIGNMPRITRALMLYAIVALAIKILLQTGSVVPAISKLAFGFRPIVIAYLHLVLLAFITIFLVAYAQWQQWLQWSRLNFFASVLLAAGVFFNEAILATQGIASFSYTVLPYADRLLFIVSILICLSLCILAFSFFRKMQEPV